MKTAARPPNQNFTNGRTVNIARSKLSSRSPSDTNTTNFRTNKKNQLLRIHPIVLSKQKYFSKMVYESDFYTTRRPYSSRPVVSSYSVTVSGNNMCFNRYLKVHHISSHPFIHINHETNPYQTSWPIILLKSH